MPKTDITQTEKPLLIISRGFSFKTLIISLLVGIVGVYLVSSYNPSQLPNLLIAYAVLAALFLITSLINRPKILCFKDRLMYRSLGANININYSDLNSIKLDFPRVFGVIDSVSTFTGMLRNAKGQEGLVVIEGAGKKIVFGMITFKEADLKVLVSFIRQHAPHVLIDQKLSEKLVSIVLNHQTSNRISFKALLRFPSKLPNAWFYYSIIYLIFSTVHMIVSKKIGNESNISSIILSFAGALMFIVVVIQIIVNFIRLLRNKPEFNMKKVFFVCLLIIVLWQLIQLEHALYLFIPA